MTEYMKKMLVEFCESYKLDGFADTPAGNDLFAKGRGEMLDETRKKHFHTFVAKALFACKRGRPDLQLAATVLASRVQAPTTNDWKKLLRMLKFVNGTINNCLILLADDLSVVKWYVDASFGVHPDFQSHTGAVMMMGKGAVLSGLNKQRLNTRSSC